MSQLSEATRIRDAMLMEVRAHVSELHAQDPARAEQFASDFRTARDDGASIRESAARAMRFADTTPLAGAALRGLEGLTFGFADELTPLATRAAKGLHGLIGHTDETPDFDPDRIAARLRTEREAFSARHPYLGFAAEAAPAAATGGLMGKLAGLSLGTARGLAAVGAAEGALSGAGHAEPGQRLEGALEGGVLGAAGGAAAPVVARAGAAGLRAAGRGGQKVYEATAPLVKKHGKKALRVAQAAGIISDPTLGIMSAAGMEAAKHGFRGARWLYRRAREARRARGPLFSPRTGRGGGPRPGMGGMAVLPGAGRPRGGPPMPEDRLKQFAGVDEYLESPEAQGDAFALMRTELDLLPNAPADDLYDIFVRGVSGENIDRLDGYMKQAFPDEYLAGIRKGRDPELVVEDLFERHGEALGRRVEQAYSRATTKLAKEGAKAFAAAPRTLAQRAAAGEPNAHATWVQEEIQRIKMGVPKPRTDVQPSDVEGGYAAVMGREPSPQEWRALSGAPQDVNVTVEHAFADAVDVYSVAGGYRASRRFREDLLTGERYIMNESLDVKGMPKGTGTKLFAQQVYAAQNAGFDHIRTYAAGLGRGTGIDDPLNGYYTWARLGYDATVKVPEQFRKHWGGATKLRISDVMSTAKGRERWRKYGFGANMRFDLTPGSYSMRTLEAYLEEISTR